MFKIDYAQNEIMSPSSHLAAGGINKSYHSSQLQDTEPQAIEKEI